MSTIASNATATYLVKTMSETLAKISCGIFAFFGNYTHLIKLTSA